MSPQGPCQTQLPQQPKAQTIAGAILSNFTDQTTTSPQAFEQHHQSWTFACATCWLQRRPTPTNTIANRYILTHTFSSIRLFVCLQLYGSLLSILFPQVPTECKLLLCTGIQHSNMSSDSSNDYDVLEKIGKLARHPLLSFDARDIPFSSSCAPNIRLMNVVLTALLLKAMAPLE